MRLLASFQRWLFRLARTSSCRSSSASAASSSCRRAAGMLFAVVLMVMLIGAINYNLSLGHALIFLLAGLGLVAMVHTFHNLFGLRLTPGRCPPTFRRRSGALPAAAREPVANSVGALEFSLSRTADGQRRPARRRARDGRRPLCHAAAWPPRPGSGDARHALSAGALPRLELPSIRAGRASSIRSPCDSAARAVADHARRPSARRQRPGGLRRLAAAPAQRPDPAHRLESGRPRSDEQPHLVKQFAGGAADELWLDWSLTPSEAAPKSGCRSSPAGYCRRRSAGRYGLQAARAAARRRPGRAHRAAACKRWRCMVKRHRRSQA
jgi:hypothetical protein